MFLNSFTIYSNVFYFGQINLIPLFNFSCGVYFSLKSQVNHYIRERYCGYV
jgi:hypothetical protein